MLLSPSARSFLLVRTRIDTYLCAQIDDVSTTTT